jgi:uridine phosphorylase
MNEKGSNTMSTELQPHIQLKDNLQAQYALLPGDPKRVEKVKQFLTNTKEIAYNREYRSVLGYYKGIAVLVLSTGIGGPSAGIAIEELANIGVTTLIRIGSSGALQDNIQLGDLIIATGAVRDEGTSKAYIDLSYPAVANHQLISALTDACERKDVLYHTGLIRSHDSFYTDREEEIDSYWSAKGILGSDMETSTLFVVGALRGLQTASILNVVVPSKGNLQSGINDLVGGESLPAKGEENQILVALEGIASIHNKKEK